MPHTIRFFSLLFFASLLGLFGCSSAKRATPISKHPSIQSTSTQVAANYGQVPLSFEANHGQAKEPVKFLARGTNATLYLTPNEAALEVRSSQPTTDHQPPTTALVKMKLVGANKQPQLQGQEELPGKSNYFSGNDPKQWQTDIPTYEKVKYSQVYEGIDLVYYGNQQQLEYDFIVAPGADPQAIKLRFEGVEEVALNDAGELVLQTAAGQVKQHKPVIYQEVNGSRQEIVGNYVLRNGEVSFAVGEYDVTQPLVIDPVIQYITYHGTLPAWAIAADKEGNAYVGGQAAASAGAYSSGTGQSITKLNPNGTAVIFSATFAIGNGGKIRDLKLDAQGNVYVTGSTSTSQFPTTPGAFQTDFGLTGSNFHNAFVMKLNAQGNTLIYSTYLKGDQLPPNATKQNFGNGIAVDKDGNAFIAGSTNAINFPVTTGAFQTQIPSQYNSGFVTKLNATGTALLYSTYLGSGSGDRANGIAIDSAGNAYVTGYTGNGYIGQAFPRKAAFPQTAGAFQTTDDLTYGGLYVVKLNSTGSTLVYSTIIGQVYLPISAGTHAIAVDSGGHAYIAGSTNSATFPTTPGAYRTTGGSPPGDFKVDLYLTKLKPDGSGLVYSTFLGGQNTEEGWGLAIDQEGNAYLTGWNTSSDFPQIGLPLQTDYLGSAFVMKVNATGSGLLLSGLIPKSRGYALAIDPSANVYIAGNAGENFQPTPGAYQPTEPTPFDSGFVAKISTPRSATTVDGAAYTGDSLAAESIVSSFGNQLALSTLSASSLPLPTTLVGTSIKVTDSIGTERAAQLFFVSPTQVNFQIPPGTANGAAMITITNSEGGISLSPVQIVNVKPSLFSAEATGRGLAAAQVQRTGSTVFETVFRFDPLRGQIVAVPIDLGAANEQVYLILYGTGLRLRSSVSQVTATIGGTAATVSYAGAQNDFVGLDQVNVLIPRSLIGRGVVDVVLNVEGKAANTITVNVK